MSVEERLIDLEIRLENQSNVITSLDEVVREFATRVERLERRLAEAVRDQGDGGIPVPNDRPPHY
jgi:uncharacterized coiled-coil protein SlyX